MCCCRCDRHCYQVNELKWMKPSLFVCACTDWMNDGMQLNYWSRCMCVLVRVLMHIVCMHVCDRANDWRGQRNEIMKERLCEQVSWRENELLFNWSIMELNFFRFVLDEASSYLSIVDVFCSFTQIAICRFYGWMDILYFAYIRFICIYSILIG